MDFLWCSWKQLIGLLKHYWQIYLICLMADLPINSSKICTEFLLISKLRLHKGLNVQVVKWYSYFYSSKVIMCIMDPWSHLTHLRHHCSYYFLRECSTSQVPELIIKILCSLEFWKKCLLMINKQQFLKSTQW